MRQLLGRDVGDRDTAELGLLTYLRRSGSGRPILLDGPQSAGPLPAAWDG